MSPLALYVNISDPSDNPDSLWAYHPWHELDSYPFWGELDWYSGGGYVAELGQTLAEAREVVAELREGGWLDRNTRVVFIEFLLYNPNLNLFGVSESIVEWPQIGGRFVLMIWNFTRWNLICRIMLHNQVVIIMHCVNVCWTEFPESGKNIEIWYS